jgi:hypothetical protein
MPQLQQQQQQPTGMRQDVSDPFAALQIGSSSNSSGHQQNSAAGSSMGSYRGGSSGFDFLN